MQGISEQELTELSDDEFNVYYTHSEEIWVESSKLIDFVEICIKLEGHNINIYSRSSWDEPLELEKSFFSKVSIIDIIKALKKSIEEWDGELYTHFLDIFNKNTEQISQYQDLHDTGFFEHVVNFKNFSNQYKA